MSAAKPVEFLLYLILLFPIVLIVLDSCFRLAFLLIALLSHPRTEPMGPPAPDRSLLMLVVAHDEEKAIEQTLKAIGDQADNITHLVVLADHCSDRTSSIAACTGASVYARSEGLAGKAEALAWFSREARDLLMATDLIAVLDADSLIMSDFCEKLRTAFQPGVEAVQSFVKPVSGNGFPLTALVSFSELLSEKIDDAARSKLGWSVPLRGTGMAFRSQVFLQACARLQTQVDDIELSVRLAELGIPVRFDPRVIVSDPKSDKLLGLARQRGRWLKGQRQVWRTEGCSILRLLKSGLPNWSLIQALLLKPKTALGAIRIGLVAMLWAWPFPPTLLHGVLFWVVAGSLMVDVIYSICGLGFTGNAGKYLLSLLTSPALLLLWGLSWAYSLLPTREWLRTDDGQEPTQV